jgi:hypothetical protein
MADQKHSETWSDVPNGSTLEISVKGTTSDNFIVATVEYRVAPGQKGKLPTNKAVLDTTGTPLVIPLKSPNLYSAQILIAFMTDADGKFRAVVKTPSGKQFGKALAFDFSGKAGDVVSATLLVITA